MLRHLGQRLERDPERVHPRVGEIDPSDSVFVVFLFPERDAPDITPHIGSIWLSLGEAKAAAERYQHEGHPMFDRGPMSAVTVVEYETQKMQPASARHGDPLIPTQQRWQPPADETDQQRIERLERELSEMRIKLKIGVSETISAPEQELPTS